MEEKKLELILKLLAQAEGTSNEEEAKAYTERAQEIASANAISLEMARARQLTKESREELTMKSVQVGEPGREHKNRFWVDLFLGITGNNDVRCTISGDRATCYAYGYPSDIEVCELLFASLNIQMVSLANESMRNGVHRQMNVHGKTFRNNFYEGFVSAITSRLYRARTKALAEAKARDEEIMERLAPVLSDDAVAASTDAPAETAALVMLKKSETVNDYYTKTNNAKGRRSYSSYGAGRKHYGAQKIGRTAGEGAKLGVQGSVGGGPRKAIG